MNITPMPILQDNYVWMLIDQQKQLAIAVDPGTAVEVLGFLGQHSLTLAGILITHHHWDHSGGVAELLRHHKVPVVGSINSPIPELTRRVQEGDIVSFDSYPLSLNVIAIPGHTLDHIAFYGENAVFCGDTLFAAGCGRLFEGKAAQLYASLQKIAALPDRTHVYCAHEYTLNNLRFAKLVEPTNQNINRRIEWTLEQLELNRPSLPSNIGEEKATNPFLRCQEPMVIKSSEEYAGRSLSDPVEVFAVLRGWKDRF